ncbi:hypothetical protein [Leptothermofonsia sp. ETS-13]
MTLKEDITRNMLPTYPVVRRLFEQLINQILLKPPLMWSLSAV